MLGLNRMQESTVKTIKIRLKLGLKCKFMDKCEDQVTETFLSMHCVDGQGFIYCATYNELLQKLSPKHTAKEWMKEVEI